jgi:tRNA threonylcarbamoyladenosine biosynthesis protein TsaE
MRKSMSQNRDPLLHKEFPSVDETMTGQIARATAALVGKAMTQASGRHAGLQVQLHGGLGVGKTTWVRGFLRACGVEGRIKSPSFSVVETYDTGPFEVHHFDFYRESNPQGWQGGGLRDLIAQHAVTLIEWPERAAGLPPTDIDIWLDWADRAQPDGPRQLRLEFFQRPAGIAIAHLLQQWQTDVAATQAQHHQ